MNPTSKDPASGPSLETYVETRFNLLIKSMEDKLEAQDLRYEQRFQAQSKALDAAFLSQQAAMQTALAAAKEAVTKAETASDKRFEGVNEFRKTLSDQAGEFVNKAAYEALRDTVNKLEQRMEREGGQQAGGTRRAVDFRSNLGAIVGLVALAVVLYRAFTGH